MNEKVRALCLFSINLYDNNVYAKANCTNCSVFSQLFSGGQANKNAIFWNQYDVLVIGLSPLR